MHTSLGEVTLQDSMRLLTWRCQCSEVVGSTVGGAISYLVEVCGARLEVRHHNRVQHRGGVVQGCGSTVAGNCGVVDLAVHL